jgi:hypothetical protein
MTTISKEPVIKFSNEESKALIRSKLGQNLQNLIELTKSTIQSSESSDLFKNSFRAYLSHEKQIESTLDRVNKLEIISKQLNLQVEQIKKESGLLNEVCAQIKSIQNDKKYVQ